MDAENKARVEEYVLTPKKRWGRRILKLMILLGVPLLLVGWHWWAGDCEEQALHSEMMGLDRMGEPMFASDFNNVTSLPEGENAVPLLRGAGNAIDDDSDAWRF